MRNRAALPITVGLMFAFSVSADGQETNESRARLVQKLKEAFSAAVDNFKSGTGSGVFEHDDTTEGRPPVADSKRAKLAVQFDTGKYNIVLTFPREKGKILDRRVIVCDRKALMFADFWTGIPHPTGAEAYLYDAQGEYVQPRSAEFPWDVSCLPKQIFNPIAFFEKFPNASVEARDGKIFGSCHTAPDVLYSFEADERSGFNITRRSAGNTKDKAPVHWVEAAWKKVDGHWVVSEITEQVTRRSRGHVIKWRLRYDQFKLKLRCTGCVVQSGCVGAS